MCQLYTVSTQMYYWRIFSWVGFLAQSVALVTNLTHVVNNWAILTLSKLPKVSCIDTLADTKGHPLCSFSKFSFPRLNEESMKNGNWTSNFNELEPEPGQNSLRTREGLQLYALIKRQSPPNLIVGDMPLCAACHIISLIQQRSLNTSLHLSHSAERLATWEWITQNEHSTASLEYWQYWEVVHISRLSVQTLWKIKW